MESSEPGPAELSMNITLSLTPKAGEFVRVGVEFGGV